jgi:hypothetical protein
MVHLLLSLDAESKALASCTIFAAPSKDLNSDELDQSWIDMSGGMIPINLCREGQSAYGIYYFCYFLAAKAYLPPN